MSSIIFGCSLAMASIPTLAQLSLQPGQLILPSLAVPTPRSGFCAMHLAQTANSLGKIGTKAYSTPISTTQIQFSATTSESGTVTLRVQEGAMGKVVSVKGSSGYALIPTLNPINHEQVDFTVMKLTVDGKGNESVSYLGKVTGTIGQNATLEGAHDLTLDLISITPESDTSSSTSFRSVKPVKHPIEICMQQRIKLTAA